MAAGIRVVGKAAHEWNVGIGTTSPQAALDVQTATPGLKVGATCVSGTCPSDRRLKSGIRYLDGSLGVLAKLKPASYRYKGDPSDRKGYGLVAQDVEKVMPWAVSEGKDGMKRVDYSALEMMLIDSVRQLKTENDELRRRLDALERAQGRPR